MNAKIQIQAEGDTNTWTTVALLEAATDLIIKMFLVKTGDHAGFEQILNRITDYTRRHGYLLITA